MQRLSARREEGFVGRLPLLNLAAALKRNGLGDRSDSAEFAMFVEDLSGPRAGQFMQPNEAAAGHHIFGLGFRVFSGNGTYEDH